MFNLREPGKGIVGLHLVPVCNRGYIICQRSVPSGFSSVPAQRLNCHPQLFLETDWIHDVPSVQTPFAGTAISCTLVVQCIANIRCRVDFRKSIASTKIVFSPCPADRRKSSVPVNKELHLTFAEPTGMQLSPCQERSNVLTFSFDVIEDSILRV